MEKDSRSGANNVIGSACISLACLVFCKFVFEETELVVSGFCPRKHCQLLNDEFSNTAEG